MYFFLMQRYCFYHKFAIKKSVQTYQFERFLDIRQSTYSPTQPQSGLADTGGATVPGL